MKDVVESVASGDRDDSAWAVDDKVMEVIESTQAIIDASSLGTNLDAAWAKVNQSSHASLEQNANSVDQMMCLSQRHSCGLLHKSVASYYLRTRSYDPNTSQSIRKAQVVVESTKQYFPGRQLISDTEGPFLFTALYVFLNGRSIRFIGNIFIHHVHRQAMIGHLSSRMLL